MLPLTEGKGNVTVCRGGGHPLPDLYFKKVQLNLWNKDAKKNIHVGLKAED